MIKTVIKRVVPAVLWSRLRRKKIVKEQDKVARVCDKYIRAYFSSGEKLYNAQPKKDLHGRKVIWQYWAQGFDDNLPQVVKDCMESVDKFKGDYEVIRLSDDTISEYVDLPDYVWDKRGHGFSITAFSNVLRLALLDVYGGLWLDVTVLLTGYIPARYEGYDYFMFQRDESEPHKNYWENTYAYYFGWGRDFKVRVLTSIIFAKPKSIFIDDYLNLLLIVWKVNDRYPFYFTFQVLYNQLCESGKTAQPCPVESDCIPHVIMQIINDGFPYMSVGQVINTCSIHKLSFKEMNMEQYSKVITIVK